MTVAELTEKFTRLESQIAQEKGDFTLFALFMREDVPDRWDLIVSAPWLGDDKRAAVDAEERAERRESTQIVGIDATVSEVAHEQVPGKCAERARRDRQAPRGIQGSAGCHAAREVSLEIEYIHEAEARSRHIVVLGCILQRVGHVDLAGEKVDIEGGIARRQSRVGEITRQVRLTGGSLEHIDGAGAKVGRKQIVA